MKTLATLVIAAALVTGCSPAKKLPSPGIDTGTYQTICRYTNQLQQGQITYDEFLYLLNALRKP